MGLTKKQREVLKWSEAAYKKLAGWSKDRKLDYRLVFPGLGRGNMSGGSVSTGVYWNLTQTRIFTYEESRSAEQRKKKWYEIKATGPASSLRYVTTVQTFNNVETKLKLEYKDLNEIKTEVKNMVVLLKDLENAEVPEKNYWNFFCKFMNVSKDTVQALESKKYRPARVSLRKEGKSRKMSVTYLRMLQSSVFPTTLDIRFDESTEKIADLRELIPSHCRSLESILKIRKF